MHDYTIGRTHQNPDGGVWTVDIDYENINTDRHYARIEVHHPSELLALEIASAIIEKLNNPQGKQHIEETELQLQQTHTEEVMPSHTPEINLMQTTDAHIWAKEFVRINGGDEGAMIGWFAAMWAATNDPLARHIEELEAHNAQLRDGRRERIATAALTGILAADGPFNLSSRALAEHCVNAADSLIAKLDEKVTDSE